MVCSCSGSTTANIWTFFCSLQSKCNQGFSLHPFLSLSNLGTETIVTATYSWVNWDNKLRYSLFAMYCFLSQTLAVRNTPRLLYLQCPWNQRGTDITSLAQIATSWEKANIHAICNYNHGLAHPFKMCKSFLTTKMSLGSPPNVPHFVQSSFEALLKHPNHLTYMFTSLLHRDIRLVFSLTDLQVLINWHLSIHSPHKCHHEIDQVWLHNFLLQKLSLLLSTFHLRLWQSKRPQFE
jgi:hypothetical protein